MDDVGYLYQDVTQEATLEGFESGLEHPAGNLVYDNVDSNYRLRKVSLLRRVDNAQHIHEGFTKLPVLESVSAFVLEMRTP